jgi:hypothetical protein
MEEELGEEKYRVLRKERSVHTAELTIYYEEGTVVALVQNHYSKVIQSLMHTVAGLLDSIPGKVKYLR